MMHRASIFVELTIISTFLRVSSVVVFFPFEAPPCQRAIGPAATVAGTILLLQRGNCDPGLPWGRGHPTPRGWMGGGRVLVQTSSWLAASIRSFFPQPPTPSCCFFPPSTPKARPLPLPNRGLGGGGGCSGRPLTQFLQQVRQCSTSRGRFGSLRHSNICFPISHINIHHCQFFIFFRSVHIRSTFDRRTSGKCNMAMVSLFFYVMVRSVYIPVSLIQGCGLRYYGSNFKHSIVQI